MLELRKALAALLSVQPRLAEVLEQQSVLVGSAEQRLKWGAGANPALAEVNSSFIFKVFKQQIIIIRTKCSNLS